MTSEDLKEIHSCTGLRAGVRDGVDFDPFGKVVSTSQQVLIFTRCDQIQTRDIHGDEGSSVFPNGAKIFFLLSSLI
jgi:hypothetical protein